MTSKGFPAGAIPIAERRFLRAGLRRPEAAQAARGKSIPRHRPATDYMEHFNEAIMLLEMIRTWPEWAGIPGMARCPIRGISRSRISRAHGDHSRSRLMKRRIPRHSWTNSDIWRWSMTSILRSEWGTAMRDRKRTRPHRDGRAGESLGQAAGGTGGGHYQTAAAPRRRRLHHDPLIGSDVIRPASN